MTIVAEALGAWLVERLTGIARDKLSGLLLGSEQARALGAVSDQAIARTARELRPGSSNQEVEHLAAVLDHVFQLAAPPALPEEHRTILQALQAAMTKQLAVLGDATLTGTGESSAQVLGLPVESITEALTRNVIQEIRACGARGGPLAPLAAQLNHDVTHLQNNYVAGMLGRILERPGHRAEQGMADGRPVPRELPREPGDFTGRTAELQTLRRLIAPDSAIAEPNTPQPTDSRRHVVISAIDGMGGVGKSALAIRAARELSDAFPDGQLYVNLQAATPGLAPVAPLEALARMLRSLGLDPAEIPTGTDEAAARFRSMTADRRLLVVLDNADTAEQVRPLLPASPTCAVVVTSRRVLNTLEGTHTLHLDVLSAEQALELLGHIVGPRRIIAEPESAAEVLRLCGYLPLAIRIAGARLAARPEWPVRVLVEKLSDTAHRPDLEEFIAGDLAVRASFDVSLHSLEESPNPVEQAAAAAFGLLSLPDGPDLSVAAAARLVDQPEPSTQRLLERLVDAQLLEAPRPGRYRFHDLVRLYARHHAAAHFPEADRMRALARLFGFYAATTWRTMTLLRPGDHRLAGADHRWTSGAQQFPDVSAMLSWLEAERANLLAAINQVAGAAPAIPAELATQLARALHGFLMVHSYWHDGLEASQTALRLARESADRVAQAHTGNDLGEFSEWLGRYQEAIDRYQESLALFRELGDGWGQAASLTNLGTVHARLGRYQEAIRSLQDSLTIRRELGDQFGMAISLGNLGMIHERLGQHNEAIAGLESSLTIDRELGDLHGQAISLGNLGLVQERLGRHGEAITSLQSSLTIFRDLGDRRGQAHSLNNLGLVYERLGRHQEAVACQQDSLTIWRELGHRHGQVEAWRDLGDALLSVGRDEQARAAWREALAISEELRIPEADEIRDRLATGSVDQPAGG